MLQFTFLLDLVWNFSNFKKVFLSHPILQWRMPTPEGHFQSEFGSSLKFKMNLDYPLNLSLNKLHIAAYGFDRIGPITNCIALMKPCDNKRLTFKNE